MNYKQVVVHKGKQGRILYDTLFIAHFLHMDLLTVCYALLKCEGRVAASHDTDVGMVSFPRLDEVFLPQSCEKKPQQCQA